MAAKLHIVCFDVPYPPDYGGAIDLYYKIKSLAASGCEIYLHCYEYGRGPAAELNRYCKEVWYYPRTTGWKGVSLSVPYIVNSRKDKQLLERLTQIDAPILFEGVHTTCFLNAPALKHRFKAIRTHNIEHQYYGQLQAKAGSFVSGMYFRMEAALLKKYEHQLERANAFFGLSLTDHDYFKKLYPNAAHIYLPPFHPYDEVTSITGIGGYCLYHGNLSHPENRAAVLFLLKEVFTKTDIEIVIAGKVLSKKNEEEYIAACNKAANCRLVFNPGAAAMETLIQNAQIHVLPTFQQSGMKLKLLSSLFGGRHVLVNDDMLYGSGLEGACHVANSAKAMLDKVDELIVVPFAQEDIALRREQLKAYTNANNAAVLMKALALYK